MAEAKYKDNSKSKNSRFQEATSLKLRGWFKMPTCPHCKYEFDAEDIYHTGSTEFPTENDSDETYTKCSSCGEKLLIVLSLTPEWTFTDEDGEEL